MSPGPPAPPAEPPASVWPAPPWAPLAVTVSCVTPAGTVNVCATPVPLYVKTTVVCDDCAHAVGLAGSNANGVRASQQAVASVMPGLARRDIHVLRAVRMIRDGVEVMLVNLL
jgi:hypothetical protein